MITIVAPRNLRPLEADVLKQAKRRILGTMPVQFVPSLSQPDSGNTPPSAVVVLGSGTPPTSAPLVPTLSPAQLIARPDAMTVLTAAFRLALKHEQGDLPPRPDGSYTLASRRWKAVSWLEEVYEQGHHSLYIDIETQGDIRTLHPSERRLLCAALHNRDTGQTLMLPESLLDQPWPALLDLLGKFRLSAHNGKFDLATLCLGLGGSPGDLELSFDTMLAHYALQPAGGEHALEPLCVRYLGAEPWDVGGDKTFMAALHEGTLHTYNALDVQWGAMLEAVLSELLDPDTSRALHEVLLPASNMLQKIEPEGIGFDVEYTRHELAEQLGHAAEWHRRELVRMAHTVLPRVKTVHKARSKTTKDPETGEKVRHTWSEPVEIPYEFNPGSWQQIKQLYRTQGISLPSTDEETMAPRANRDDRFAAELLAWRKVNKQLSTYADSLLKKVDRVHGDTRRYPSYKLHGTVTGRLSSENPNIQNIPRDKRLRKMFVPFARDRRLLQVDFAQAELRVIAAESGCKWLLDIFADPEADIFSQMLPAVFPATDFDSADAATVKELRAKLKGVVYGLNFGRQAPAIANAIGSTVVEAKRIIDLFFDSAPEVADWRAWVMRCVRTGEPLVSRFGRHFQREVLTPRNMQDAERSALSFIPQSNSSDVTLLSAVDIVNEIESSERNWYVVALVHDAVTLDVPEDEVEEAAKLLSDTMLARAERHFPEVPFATDANWGLTWAETS